MAISELPLQDTVRSDRDVVDFKVMLLKHGFPAAMQVLHDNKVIHVVKPVAFSTNETHTILHVWQIWNKVRILSNHFTRVLAQIFANTSRTVD